MSLTQELLKDQARIARVQHNARVLAMRDAIGHLTAETRRQAQHVEALEAQALREQLRLELSRGTAPEEEPVQSAAIRPAARREH